MTLPQFLLTAVLWTGFLALVAELLTRTPTPARFAQTIWRGAAFLMALPWLAAVIAYFWPAARFETPYIPDWTGAGFAELTPTIAAVSEAPAAPGGPSLGALLVGLLVAGWLCRAALIAVGQYRLQSLKRAAQAAPLRRQVELDGVARLQGLSRTPLLLTFPGDGSPFVAGIRRPAIYVPEAQLAARDLTAILAHECAHIRRGDLVLRPLERLVADLIWFSPFAWMARARLDHLREVVCDADAIASTGSAMDYARALVQTARASRGYTALPAASFISPRRKSLPRRIDALVGPQPTMRPVRGVLAALIGVIALPLALAQPGTGASSTTDEGTFTHPLFTGVEARLTSSYGERYDPFTRKKAWHTGIDVGTGGAGTPIHSPACGTVVYVGKRDGYGKLIDIRTDDGKIMRFSQLSHANVEKGEEVSAGDIIGQVGSSGRSTGPHLHFEVRDIDPETGEKRVVDPIEAGVKITADS